MTETPSEPGKIAAERQEGTLQPVDWGNFREHIASAHQDGRRKWFYPKVINGFWRTWRIRLSWVLIAVMFAGPWVRIHGQPLLMMNIVERKFSILGHVFWPEDMILLAAAMLLYFTSITIFTASFGRLWCGWTCPQTVMMEMVFRRIEVWIEGDALARQALDQEPWSLRKVRIKLLKLGIFFALSFVVGNTLLQYVLGTDAWLKLVTDNPAKHLTGLAFMLAFTLLFFAIFARFREQACVFICPYGRFMSALMDENTLVIAYDHKRGEARAPHRQGESADDRRRSGAGDCVNCRQCVAVCPTGIDIRDGIQMECVNCTACIDACDSVMEKVGSPKGLIRYASLNGIEHGRRFHLTLRLKVYCVVLAAVASLFVYLVLSRPEVEAMVLRAPGSLFQVLENGDLNNLYTYKIINKSNEAKKVELRLEEPAGRLEVMGGLGSAVAAAANHLEQGSILISLPKGSVAGHQTRLRIGVYIDGKAISHVKTSFLGPRDDTITPGTP
jgi:cytochrome c oxidase accessory protein FixG